MKKIFTILVFFSSNALHSQTITQSDLPFAGLGWTMGRDTNYVTPVPAGGTGQSWNFSSLQNVVEDTAYFMDAAGTPYAGSFPSANICTHRANTSNWAYFTNSSSGLYVNGFVTDTGLYALSPPQMYVPVPFSYGDSHTDISRFQIDTVYSGFNARAIFHFHNTFEGDGTGSLVTPTGNYPSTLRVRQTQLETDSFLVDLLGTGNYQLIGPPTQRQTTIYRWYRHGGTANYLMGLVADSLGNNSASSEYLLQYIVLSGNALSAVPGLNVYTAISGMQLVVSSKEVPEVFELYEATGQKVHAIRPYRPVTHIDLTGFSPGLYLYRAVIRGQPFTGKIVLTNR